jgi:hypothetical protein
MDIKELEALARAATPGEWEKRNWPGLEWPQCRISVASGDTAIVISPRYAQEQVEHDTAYIAAANPQTVLKLIEVIRAQQEAVFELDLYSSWHHSYCDSPAKIKARAALAKANEVLGDSHD